MTSRAIGILLAVLTGTLNPLPAGADDPSRIPNTYEGTGTVHQDEITDGEISIYCDVDFFVKWKLWTIFGEPVVDNTTAWRISGDPIVASATFLEHYVIPYGGLRVPDEILRDIGICQLDFSGYLHANALPYYVKDEGTTVLSTQLAFDAGIMAKPCLGSFESLGPEERRRCYSFNVPSSPEWEEFLCYEVRYDSFDDSIERYYLSRSSAMDLYRSGINSMSLRLLRADYDLSAVKEWLLSLERSAAEQAGARTDAVEEELRRARADEERADRIIEERRRMIASRPEPGRGRASGDDAHRLNLLLLIDVSGSMSGEKLASAKRAAVDSVRTAIGKDMRTAVWAFSGLCGSPVKSRIDLTDSEDVLEDFIESLSAGGGTPMYGALEIANRYLQDEYDRTGTPGMIVLLADGEDSCGNRSSALGALTGGNVKIRHEVIGLGIPSGSESFRQLNEIARLTGGRFHGAARSEELGEVFSSIVAGIEMLDMLGQFGGSGSSSPERREEDAGGSGSSMDRIMDSWEIDS